MQDDDILIARHFITATRNVLATMAGLEATAGKPYTKKNKPKESDISAIIGVTGDRKGTIAMTFARQAAKALLVAMLGDDVQDVQDEQCDMEDVVGEIANIVSGQARAGITESGPALHGSTPTVVTGAAHMLQHKASGQTIAIPFSLGGSTFDVEFCFDAPSGV